LGIGFSFDSKRLFRTLILQGKRLFDCKSNLNTIKEYFISVVLHKIAAKIGRKLLQPPFLFVNRAFSITAGLVHLSTLSFLTKTKSGH